MMIDLTRWVCSDKLKTNEWNCYGCNGITCKVKYLTIWHVLTDQEPTVWYIKFCEHARTIISSEKKCALVWGGGEGSVNAEYDFNLYLQTGNPQRGTPSSLSMPGPWYPQRSSVPCSVAGRSVNTARLTTGPRNKWPLTDSTHNGELFLAQLHLSAEELLLYPSASASTRKMLGQLNVTTKAYDSCTSGDCGTSGVMLLYWLYLLGVLSLVHVCDMSLRNGILGHLDFVMSVVTKYFILWNE